jgi:hypothetical protein
LLRILSKTLSYLSEIIHLPGQGPGKYTMQPLQTSPESSAHEPTVSVIYNGLEKVIPYQPHAAVQALLEHARQAFEVHQNPHLLGLFTETGVELSDQISAEAAGVKPHARLLLRPSAVRGGAI